MVKGCKYVVFNELNTMIEYFGDDVVNIKAVVVCTHKGNSHDESWMYDVYIPDLHKNKTVVSDIISTYDDGCYSYINRIYNRDIHSTISILKNVEFKESITVYYL